MCTQIICNSYILYLLYFLMGTAQIHHKEMHLCLRRFYSDNLKNTSDQRVRIFFKKKTNQKTLHFKYLN